MEPHINIREYRKEDKQALLQVLRMNTPAYFAPEEEKDLEFYLDNEIEQYYVVEAHGQVIGAGGINFFENGRSGRISWDLIHPDHQGQGIGSRLLNHRLDLLKAMKEVVVISVRTTQLVYEFYKKHGFELNAISKNYWAEGLDLYDMGFRELKK